MSIASVYIEVIVGLLLYFKQSHSLATLYVHVLLVANLYRSIYTDTLIILFDS